jgi:hypothetical protein
LRIVLSFSGFGARHHRNRNRVDLLVRCLTLTESQLSYFYSVTDQPATYIIKGFASEPRQQGVWL